MAGLSADRNTIPDGSLPFPTLTNYPVAASTTIYKGSLVCIDSSGNLVPGDQSASVVCVGMANEHVDNSTGLAAAKTCQVVQGVFRWDNGNAITKASAGALAWVIDDHTVSSSSAGATAAAGTIYFVDSIGVWVQCMLATGVNATSLTTFESNLANTTIANGASLVGIHDTGGIITATTVEAATQEIQKNALAALGDPVVIPVTLAQVTTNSMVVARFTPAQPGKILSINASVAQIATTTSKSLTLTPFIAGTSVSVGTLALTTANCTTMGATITGASITAGNSYSGSQEITIVSSAVTPFVEGQVLVYLQMGSS